MSFLWVIVPIIVIVVIGIDLWARYRFQKENDQTKTLNLLQQLSDIILSSITNVEEVAQQVSDAIAFTLDFQVGVILLVDPQKKVLRRVAVSRTERVAQAVNKIGFHFKGLETPLNVNTNLTVQVALDGKPRVTNNLYDVLQPHVSVQQAAYIQQVGELSASYIYPINAKNNRIGVIIFSLSNKSPELTEKRKKIIVRVLQEVGIALENAVLYQDLQITGQKLEQANARLKELDKLKDDFVSVASHELRTPMTAIRSYAWMALNRSDIPLTPKLKKYLERTMISTERLINLVNEMLNISRIESGRIEIRPSIFDIQTLTQEVFDEVEAKAKERNVHLTVTTAPMPKLYADPDKVHQVLLNLIGNALKFTPESGVIAVSFFSDGKVVDVSIKDNGVGISKEDLSRLFKKFGRLDSSYVTAGVNGGTGLGLYICKSLVELMGGRIWVQSEGVGKGSTFSFSLPIASKEILSHPDQYQHKPIGEAKGLEPVAI